MNKLLTKHVRYLFPVGSVRLQILSRTPAYLPVFLTEEVSSGLHSQSRQCPVVWSVAVPGVVHGGVRRR